jgi:hypothetical protein
MHASRELKQTLRLFRWQPLPHEPAHMPRRYVASPRRDTARNAGLPFTELPPYDMRAFGDSNEP